MRVLRKPAPGVNLTPRPRPDGTLPDWSRKRKAIKGFVEWALTNQRDQCAFCGFFVGDLAHRRAWSIDHFAPKGTNFYPQWTYHPLNLIITCHSCNTVFKNQYDSVATVASDYANCKFFLVHPYLDSVDDHLGGTYAGGSRRVGAPEVRSPKGSKTIELFRLDDVNYLRAINNQALRISLDHWKARVPGSTRELFRNALAELSGRRR